LVAKKGIQCSKIKEKICGKGPLKGGAPRDTKLIKRRGKEWITKRSNRCKRRRETERVWVGVTKVIWITVSGETIFQARREHQKKTT